MKQRDYVTQMNVIKKWFSKKSNIFLVLVLGLVLFQQFPLLVNNFKQGNRFIEPIILNVYEKNTDVEFPPRNSKAIAIFWATWCAPCKLEMARLKESVNSGKIPHNTIYAINPFETDSEIRKFIRTNDYPFNFIEDASLGSKLGVTVTPTTVFFENGSVVSMSSGISIWGIWKAEFFL